MTGKIFPTGWQRLFPAPAVISFIVMLFFLFQKQVPIYFENSWKIRTQKTNCALKVYESVPAFKKLGKIYSHFHRGHTQNVAAILNPCGKIFYFIKH